MGEQATSGTAWTMGDFLTDGSLAHLAEDLSSLLGCVVTLYDRSGSAIRPAEGSPPWRFEPADAADGAVVSALRAQDVEALEGFRDGVSAAPIVVGESVAGALVVRFGEGVTGERAGAVRRAVEHVAATASEFCSENVDKRRRSAELALLFRLSSLLVASRSLEESLQVALRSGMDLLEADAGAIHLVEGEPPELRLRAWAGLDPSVVRAIDRVAVDVEGADPIGDAAGGAGGPRTMARSPLMFKGQHYGELRVFGGDARVLTRREELLIGTIAEQTAAAIAGVRLEQSERERRQMHRALALAADIQRRMLPKGVPDVRGVDAAARYVPTLELGGDFYDFIPLHGHLGIVVGDVVGKGVPAALLMSAVRATLRAHATDVYDIDQVIRRVNIALTRDTRDNEFATVFFGVLDPESLRLTYCNAGHDPPVVFRRGRGGTGGDSIEAIRLGTGGMAVGIDEGQVYQREIAHLRRGDVVVAYTDGVTDARNFADQKYGFARFRECVATMLTDQPQVSAEHLVQHILWDVRRFTGLRPAVDDITLVVVRVA